MAYDEQVHGSVNDPSGEKTKSRGGRSSRTMTETGAGQEREGKRGRKLRTERENGEREAVPETVEEPKRRGWPKGKKRKPAMPDAEAVSKEGAEPERKHRGRKPRSGVGADSTDSVRQVPPVEEPKRRGWPKGKKRKPAEAEIVSEIADAAGEAANRFVWHKVAEEVPPEGERVLVRRDCDRLLSRCYDTFLREAQQTDEDIRADMGLRGYVDWMTIPE